MTDPVWTDSSISQLENLEVNHQGEKELKYRRRCSIHTHMCVTYTHI